MEAKAIELIQSTAVDATRVLQIEAPPTTIVLPKTHELVDLERFQPHRRRFRGSLVTAAITDFVDYVKRHPGGQAFVDGDDFNAVAFFNLGKADDAEPGHADHTATLQLKTTAPYRALLQLASLKFDQRGMIDFIEDWSDNLGAYDAAGESVLTSRALAAIRQVSIKQTRDTDNVEGDFHKSRSTLEQVEAKSELGLPAGFFFRCEPYLGLPMREFRLRLAVLTGGDKPVLTLRPIRLEAEQEYMAQDFLELLRERIGDSAVVTIGSFNAR